MFIKSLVISNKFGVIRQINFRKGMNLIVDETPQNMEGTTGNNVGKTTVLKLIDFCLGANGKEIYTDPETKKDEDKVVKNFLLDTEVLITLTLTDNLEDATARHVVIERNFLSRKKLIRRVNQEDLDEKEFERTLTNALIPNHYGKKPTFRQLISHHIRYKESAVNNTLKTMHSYTRDDEYETLYLFMLGCKFDQGDAKQSLLKSIGIENDFKARLESKQTKSAYETALVLLEERVRILHQKKEALNLNPDFEADFQQLNEVQYYINGLTATIGQLKLRRSLMLEALADIQSNKSSLDLNVLRNIYEQVSSQIKHIQKSFDELCVFHNQMLEEKARFIGKDLPLLESQIAEKERELENYLEREAALAAKVSRSNSFSELEKLISALNAEHQKKGEYEAVIQQINVVEGHLASLNAELEAIDKILFAPDFEESVKLQLNTFNKYFAEVSQKLYDEPYALQYKITTNRKGKKIYKFSTFNVNFSSGKKQGEISCFDIAYIQFADAEGIPCFHFLLNDKKELMHDNQLVKIMHLVEQEDVNVQFIASILQDKLPLELNDPKYFALQLSQTDKLFRIEA